MTKQDLRFAQKITNERARELYGECVEMLYEYKTKIAPSESEERPRYSIDVLELGQILNEFISARTAIAMSDGEDMMALARDVMGETATLAANINAEAKQIVSLLKEPLVVADERIVAAIEERNARTDRYGDELVDLIAHDLGDEEYVAEWMPEHLEAARLLRAMTGAERERIVRQVLDHLDQVALAQLRGHTSIGSLARGARVGEQLRKLDERGKKS